MATMTALPVRNDVESYAMTVELDGQNYLLRFRFNYRLGLWIMDIASTDGTNAIAGIPLQTGVDLIGRYTSDALPPGRFLAYDESGAQADAGRFDLGNTVVLLYQGAS